LRFSDSLYISKFIFFLISSRISLFLILLIPRI